MRRERTIGKGRPSRRRPPAQPGSKAAASRQAGKQEESWRLPSGESLADFALHAGFVGSLMMASQAIESAGEDQPGDRPADAGDLAETTRQTPPSGAKERR